METGSIEKTVGQNAFVSDAVMTGYADHVVGHQYVRVNGARVAHRHFAKGLQMEQPVRIAEKAGHAVVATLHHVLGSAGEIGPWESSHDAQHPSDDRGKIDPTPCKAL